MRAYYFGCVGQAGHHMNSYPPARNLEEYRAVSAFTYENPWGVTVDDGLRPKGTSEGQAALHYKNGWTAIAFVDFSVDSRPGSNSVFLFEGTHTFEEAVSLAEHFFPEIVQRFNFKITEYKL